MSTYPCTCASAHASHTKGSRRGWMRGGCKSESCSRVVLASQSRRPDGEQFHQRTRIDRRRTRKQADRQTKRTIARPNRSTRDARTESGKSPRSQAPGLAPLAYGELQNFLASVDLPGALGVRREGHSVFSGLVRVPSILFSRLSFIIQAKKRCTCILLHFAVQPSPQGITSCTNDFAGKDSEARSPTDAIGGLRSDIESSCRCLAAWMGLPALGSRVSGPETVLVYYIHTVSKARGSNPRLLAHFNLDIPRQKLRPRGWTHCSRLSF